jgi:hypothetical protein
MYFDSFKMVLDQQILVFLLVNKLTQITNKKVSICGSQTILTSSYYKHS